MSTIPDASGEEQGIASVLFGRTRRLLLGWLLGHPDEINPWEVKICCR
jgi:hypothetical protein